MGKRKKRQRMSSNKKKLKKQLRAEPAFKNLKIVEATNEEKMSAVILQFVEPYKAEATSIQAYEKLIVLAMAAWNAALLEGEAQQQMIEGVKETLLSSSGQEWNQALDQVLTQLIQRKERYFADNKRFIIDYRVSESEDEYNLAIASTPLP
jgi:hypothetical protein